MSKFISPLHKQCQEIYFYLVQKELVIRNQLQNVFSDYDGYFEDLNYSVKPILSMENKLVRLAGKKGCESNELLKNVSDFIRYTYIVEETKMFHIIHVLPEKLELSGFRVIKTDDYFSSPKKGTYYKGFHVDVLSSDGIRVEIQMHTKKSYDAKIEAHPLYVQTRNKNCSRKLRRILLKRQQLIFDAV